MSKERPILFSAPMVRAILEGRKTQTRRIIKLADGSHAQDEDIPAHGECDGIVIPPPDYVMDFSKHLPRWKRRDCPYGKPGDRLWVRETWAPDFEPYEFIYRADDEARASSQGGRWRPSIHMPRWASRITLEVEDVRVERLQDISEEDAKAEGIRFVHGTKEIDTGHLSHDGTVLLDTAKRAFYHLWESINGPGSWEDNPWVWVITFKRINP